MKEDEYIDLDKINVVPKEGEMPGISKEHNQAEKQELKPENKEKQKEDKKEATKKTKKKKTTKKKTAKTTAKKTTKKKKTSKKPLYFLIGLIILAILVIVVATTFSKNAETKEDKVLMLVNGEPINEKEVQTRADWLRLLNGIPITDEQALELTIDTELLYQEAKRQNMTITDQELDELFWDMAMSIDLTQQELIEYIEGFGVNYEMLRVVFKKELMARQILEQELYEKEVTEEELQKYYEENKQRFTYDEFAVIKHIQINFDNRTEEETYEEALRIMQELEQDKSNFCELVETHSEEWTTSSTCGEYLIETNFTHIDELFTESLKLEDDEVAIIKTIDGYHVTWREETIPAGISTYEEVKEILESMLIEESVEIIYLELLQRLKEEANIDYFTEREELEIDLSELFEELEEKIEEKIEEESEEESEETIEEELQETIEEEITEEESEEVVEEESQQQELTITYVETQQPISEETRKLRLAKCLTDKGAKMYNTYWSPDGKKQAELFGEYFEHIVTIECDAKGTNPKLAECKNVLKKEYPTYPTWLINGQLIEGYQNLNNLARISGCEY
jgi:foldase protein PrsA